MKRIKDNLFTTALGLILAVVLWQLVYDGKATFTEVAGALPMALALILSKDAEFFRNFFPWLNIPSEPKDNDEQD